MDASKRVPPEPSFLLPDLLGISAAGVGGKGESGRGREGGGGGCCPDYLSMATRVDDVQSSDPVGWSPVHDGHKFVTTSLVMECSLLASVGVEQ